MPSLELMFFFSSSVKILDDTCGSTLNTFTFSVSMALGVVGITANLFVGLSMNRLGKKKVLCKYQQRLINKR